MKSGDLVVGRALCCIGRFIGLIPRKHTHAVLIKRVGWIHVNLVLLCMIHQCTLFQRIVCMWHLIKTSEMTFLSDDVTQTERLDV